MNLLKISKDENADIGLYKQDDRSAFYICDKSLNALNNAADCKWYGLCRLVLIFMLLDKIDE